MVQNDMFHDVEKGLATSRASWMGQEMLNAFRGGRKSNVFDMPSRAKM